LAGVFGIAGILAAAGSIRELDARAWLPRYGRRIFLVPAAVAAITAMFLPGTAAGVLTLVAVVLTAGTVLLATDLMSAVLLLHAAAMIGAGLAVIGFGVTKILGHEAVEGVAFIVAGAALSSRSAETLAKPFQATGMTSLLRSGVVGVLTIAAGVVWFVPGALSLAAGVVWLFRWTGTGMTMFALGAVGFGVGMVGLGVTALARQRGLYAIASIGFGVATVWVGGAVLASRELLMGAAMIGTGIAAIGIGVALKGPGNILSGFRQLVDSVTKAPVEVRDGDGLAPPCPSGIRVYSAPGQSETMRDASSSSGTGPPGPTSTSRG
jgi:hypothetical protein